MISKTERSNQVRSIEKEFGFYVRYKNTASQVRGMAEEIYRLRHVRRSLELEAEDHQHRVRTLELQISQLDRKLNG